MKRALNAIGSVAEFLQLAAFALFVGIGPLVWAFRLASAGSVALAWLVVAGWFLSSILVLGARLWRLPSAVPLGVFLAWLVTLAFVFSSRLGRLP